jgi:8-oxo-dGTP diphosphatase
MVVAVGAIILVPASRGAKWRVLLVERGRPPHAGSWTLPGGKVEPGESLAEAIQREVLEETGLEVRVLEETELVELRGDGYAYAVHEHLCVPADASTDVDAAIRAGDDARAVRWTAPDEFDALDVTPEVRAVVARAAKRAWRTA